MARGAAGVYERGKGTRGFPRNLGDPNCPTVRSGFTGDHRKVLKHPGLH